MNVDEAIRAAERVLPGQPSLEGEQDPRWQAIVAVGEHIETDPDPIWSFVERWGSHPEEDIRAAVATCLLEHLLETHFDLLFPRVESLPMENVFFADTFTSCWKFGQSEVNAKRMHALAQRCTQRDADEGNGGP